MVAFSKTLVLNPASTLIRCQFLCCRSFAFWQSEFIENGICLQEQGHRVRLATHSDFKDFVLTAGLEFFPLGGDAKVLAGCK